MTMTIDKVRKYERDEVLSKIRHAYAATSSKWVLMDIQNELRRGSMYANVTRLSQLIEMDPRLKASLLKWANSPVYGMPQEVTGVRHAIVIVGLSSLFKSLLFDALRNAIPRDIRCERFIFENYWKHVLGVAVAAQRLCNDFGGGAETSGEYFLAGLFHDIGKAVLAKYFRETYGACLNYSRMENISLNYAERIFFQIDHAEVGHELALKWQLPANIAHAIGGHHLTMEVPEEHSFMAHIVMLANRLTALTTIGDSFNPILMPAEEEPLASFVKTLPGYNEKKYISAIRQEIKLELARMSG